MPINGLIGPPLESIGPYAYDEPLTLEAAKAYMKIDYDTDDELISTMITAAREQLEKFTGLSFIPKFLTVQLRNECGGIEIPYGPVYDIDVNFITDKAGEPINSSLINISGLEFKFLDTPLLNFVQLQYYAGYDILPQALLLAWKAQVFFMYENRGELNDTQRSTGYTSNDYIAQAAQNLCRRYSRNIELSI